MKVLVINGSPHLSGCTDRALREVEGVLKDIVSPFFDRGLNLNKFQNKERSDGGRLLLFAPTLTSQGFCFCPPQSSLFFHCRPNF